MQGHFNAMVIGDLGLGDAPFLEAIKNQNLDDLLKRHPIVAEAHTDNQVFQPLVQYLMYEIFGMPATYANFGTIGTAGMRCVTLSKLSSEPNYTDYSGGYYASDGTAASADQWSHAYNQFKRFDEEKSEPTRVWIDTDREAYYFRDRFLWLPSDGSFADIRSICCYGDQTATRTAEPYYGQYQYRCSRTRLKDSGGSPITLQKTTDQAFLVEYIIKHLSR